MELNEYQNQARKTAVYDHKLKVLYPALGLAGEAGEVANKVKKMVRDDGGALTPARREAIQSEIGGVLWYCAALCHDLGITLEDVATHNLAQLQSRRERGTIHGDGDNR